MAIIKCKMCGGDIELATDKTFGICEFCGNTMTLPKVDDEQRATAFNRGNHFRRIGEFDKALAVYEHIVREDDSDAEAHWCCALCRFGIEYVEDPATYEWLPTCHRASFDSFLEDVDYLAAVEHSEGITKRQYQKDGAKIAEVQRGILATSQNEDPFDVFICYKESDENGERTRDSLMAQDIYYQLTDQGYRVFFARITLEDVGGKEYEPYIFAALNSAKVMIVIGTKPEYMNAVWVKNEWSRFLAMMKKDRHKLLLPCYRDMDPYDMPEQLSVLQSYDMTKIGFIQDLIRGVKKVLDVEKKPEAFVGAMAMQQPATNVTALLKRGYMELEDSEWERADEFFEEVLNYDPECPDAYLGKALVVLQCGSFEQYEKKKLSELETILSEKVFYTFETDVMFDKNAYFESFSKPYIVCEFLTAEMIIKHCFNEHDGFYLSEVPGVLRKQMQEQDCWNENRMLQRALRYDREGKILKYRDRVMSAIQHRLEDVRKKEVVMKADAQKQFELMCQKAKETVEELHAKALEEQELSYKNQNNRKIPVPVVINNGELTCPICGLVQKSNRRICWNCNQVFINGQPDIPYWCARCGKPGPYYGDECPDCGGAIKIINK